MAGEKKNNNRGLVVLLGGLCVLIVGLGALILFKNVFIKDYVVSDSDEMEHDEVMEYGEVLETVEVDPVELKYPSAGPGVDDEDYEN